MSNGRDTNHAVLDCLVAKFREHRRLSDSETAFLVGLQAQEETLPPGHDVIVQGERSELLFVLKSGWAFSHKLLSNGRRQVLDIHLPGDFLGLRELAFGAALNCVTTSTTAVVCPFKKNRLRDFYDGYPKLTAVLMEISTREQALLVERIVDIGSRTAYQRIAHLFMEFLFRLRGCEMVDGSTFDLPLNQSVLGDALGLSRVHVARTLRELRENNLIQVNRNRVTVLNELGLIAAAGFEEYYLKGL